MPVSNDKVTAMNIRKKAHFLSTSLLVAALTSSGALAHGGGAMDGGMMGGAMNPMMGQGHRYPDQKNSHNPAFRYNPGVNKNLSSEDVRKILSGHLASIGNKRLKVGAINQQSDGSFLANIDTVDGSLVWHMRVDPKTGGMQPVNE